jgi:hypothetical protein
MIPIYEQGEGEGIGLSLNRFLDRFEAICSEHEIGGRAKAFAFILYDFRDQAVYEVLKSRGGFAELDRLSGNDLSVFYLHNPNRAYTDHFNASFLKLLGVEDQASTPCVVYFRVNDGRVTDATVANLQSDELVTSLHELYGVLQAFKAKTEAKPGKALSLIKSTVKFVSVEAARAALKVQFERLF